MKSTICIPDDTSGTGQWRCLWPLNLIWPSLQQSENIAVSKTFPSDLNYFAIQNTVMIQRWTTPRHRQMFDNVVFPAANGGMSNIVYNIDDCMSPDDIPTFNQSWHYYARPETQDNIKHMLSRSDFVVVTTQRLKQYYIEKYNVHHTDIIVIPNLLPRSWGFGLYNKALKMQEFEESKTNGKIRVGIISSASHFNTASAKQTKDTKIPVIYDEEKKQYTTYDRAVVVAENDIEEIPDDVDDIADVIKQTSSVIEWVSIGESANKQFQQLIKDKHIKTVPYTDILHYMQLVSSLKLSAIVAPIKDTVFNHCKSDIKYLEAAAVGSVLFTPDLQPYTTNVPDDQRWSNNSDLVAKLYTLAKTSATDFGDMIQHQYDWLNKPTHIDGGPVLHNQWLDDNINIWRSLVFMPRKGVKIHLSSIVTPDNDNSPNLLTAKQHQ